ncbi:hypothetical protein [Herbaspirillum chlorophenolicum]|uniref:hypothetical protein n=1 Tax=Herbaspirillum chlorophenolicum TaxID=211589 RepID=UPI000A9979F8|nr:hypothetical protein [Herbaspirillum chlorophenolicum]
MSNNQQLNQILEQFSDWAMPWAYLPETLTKKGLTAEDSALIENIWSDANASAHWMEPSFQSSADMAAAALKGKYSWLSDGALRNVVRSASYMWR